LHHSRGSCLVMLGPDQDDPRIKSGDRHDG
jgi:hypothetical protein